MHRLSRAYESRLRRLNRAIPPVAPTPEERARQNERRLALCRAALAGEIPADLGDGDERLLFSKIQKSAPIFMELVHEGIIDGHGQPGGVDDLGHEDEEDDQASTWCP